MTLLLRRASRVLPAIVVLSALLASAAGGAVAVPAPAAASGRSAVKPCVAVIVDASRAGGAVRTGCARTDPPNGFAALRGAGFSFRLRPDGLICQINARPGECVASTQRYWSYWYRPAGSSRWTYSSAGPGARNPRPGSTEGWVFQTAGARARPPSIRQGTICPVARRPAATRTLTATSSARSRSATPRATGSPARSPRRAASKNARRSAKPSSARASSPSGEASTPASTNSTSTSAEESPSTSEPAAVSSAESSLATSAADADANDDRGGPTIAFLAAAALIAGIGVATAVRVRGPTS